MASEEIFESVLGVMMFRTPEEAFERANNIPYGLSAGVWTDNLPGQNAFQAAES